MSNLDDLFKHAQWGMEQESSSEDKFANNLFKMYYALVRAGFDEEQAMEIILGMIHASAINGKGE